VKALVDWGDVVRTGDGGTWHAWRLTTVSVLNVGSSSTLTVTQHNAAAQQTQIELTYWARALAGGQASQAEFENLKFTRQWALRVWLGRTFFLAL